MSGEANPFPGPPEDVSNEIGPSIEDAIVENYDAQERAVDGIAEGEREEIGQYLKMHADSVGVSVRDGLDSVIGPAIDLGSGDIKKQRAVIDGLIDHYNVHPVPEAAPAAAEYAQPIATEEQAEAAIQTFTQANPLAGDPQVLATMVDVAADMRRQGYQPSLQAVYQHAVNADPRYSQQARQVQETRQVEQAKAASVQVSGGGRSAPSSSSPSDDLDNIIREQFGR